VHPLLEKSEPKVSSHVQLAISMIQCVETKLVYRFEERLTTLKLYQVEKNYIFT
jgi:hypothetical protein